MRHLIRFLAIPIILLGIVSCDGDDYNDPTPTPTPNTETFTADLRGTNEVPSNGSAAYGTATFKFNTITKTFTLTVIYYGMTPTTAHIHRGAAGTAPPNNIIFPTPTTSFTFPITNYQGRALNEAEESDLRTGLYYVNIHSTAYSTGEIRGQLIKP
jgi:hypothetical protein